MTLDVTNHLIRTGLLLFGFIAVALTGCFMSSTQTTVQDPAQVEQLARIRIPKSATDVHCVYDSGGIDQMIYGRFDVPEADLPQILEAMPEGYQVSSNGEHSSVMIHKIDDSWWKPSDLQSPQAAEWTLPGPFAVNLLFGKTAKSDVLTVYFFNFSM